MPILGSSTQLIATKRSASSCSLAEFDCILVVEPENTLPIPSKGTSRASQFRDGEHNPAPSAAFLCGLEHHQLPSCQEHDFRWFCGLGRGCWRWSGVMTIPHLLLWGSYFCRASPPPTTLLITPTCSHQHTHTAQAASCSRRFP